MCACDVLRATCGATCHRDTEHGTLHVAPSPATLHLARCTLYVGSVSPRRFDAGACALAVLRAGTARHANRAGDFSAVDDREAAFDRDCAGNAEHAHPLAAARQHVLKGL